MRLLTRAILACALLASISSPVFAQLRIVAPNGGESYPVGSGVTIRWSGVPFSDTVRIEYSINRGATWDLITDRGTGLQYLWRPVPNRPSDSCLLRITSRSASTDSVLYLPAEYVTGRREPVMYAEFSRDGTKVIGTGSNGYVFIWDAYTKAVLLSLLVEPPENPNSFTQPIYPARFSPDGNSFAVTGPIKNSINSYVRIYDANSGALVREWVRPQFVPGVSQSVSCAYSPDGTRLLVTGQRYGLIYNVSDGMQAVLLEGYSDSSVSAGVYRYGLMSDGDWTSDGGTIAGWDFGVGMVISDASAGGIIRTFATEKTFRPAAVRRSPDNSRIIAAGYDFDTLTGGGTLSPRVKLWDVGGGEVLVFNPFSRFARWADYISDGSAIAAVGSDVQGQPESLKLFDPVTGAFLRTVGTHQGNMLSVHSGPDPDRILVACNDGARIFVPPGTSGGESDLSDAAWSIARSNAEIVTISIPRLDANQGEFIDAPLTISAPAAALATGATRIDVNLSFNATLLDPAGGTPRGTVSGGIRTIPISVPITGDSVLTTLRFRAALGNDSATVLDLDSARADLPALTVAENDGEFRLLDLCYAGGARLVNPDGVAALRIRVPNPSSGTAEADLYLPSAGPALLFLSDVQGRIVRTCLRRELEAGRHGAQIDLRGLPDGRYFLVLRTSAGVSTVAMEVAQ